MKMKKKILSAATALFAALLLLTGAAAADAEGTIHITVPEEPIQIGEAFDLTLGDTIYLGNGETAPFQNLESVEAKITARLGDEMEISAEVNLITGEDSARIHVIADSCRALFPSAGVWTIHVSINAEIMDEEGEAHIYLIRSKETEMTVSAAAPQITAEVIRFGASGEKEFLMAAVRCADGDLFGAGAEDAEHWMVRLEEQELSLDSVEYSGEDTVVLCLGAAAAGGILEIQALPGAFLSGEAASLVAQAEIPVGNAVPVSVKFLMNSSLPAGLTWKLRQEENRTAPEEFRILIAGSAGDPVCDATVRDGDLALSVSEAASGVYTYTCLLPDWNPEALPEDTYSAVILSGGAESYGESWSKKREDPPVIFDQPVFSPDNAGRVPAGGTSEDVPKNPVVENTPDGSAAGFISGPGGQAAAVTLSSSSVQTAQASGGSVVLPIPAVSPAAGSVITIATGSAGPVKVEIPVEGAGPGTVAILVRPDGTEQIIRTSLAADGVVTVAVTDGDMIRIADNSEAFSDTSSHWARDAITFAAARELFSGTGGGNFTPDGGMTRAMLITVLARYDGADTEGESWYEKALAWASARGISSGENPDTPVSREQMAAMLYRYAAFIGKDSGMRGDLTGFADGDSVSGYAGEAMAWAVGAGIIGGTDKGLLAPRNGATRAEAAAILMRFCMNIL